VVVLVIEDRIVETVEGVRAVGFGEEEVVVDGIALVQVEE